MVIDAQISVIDVQVEKTDTENNLTVSLIMGLPLPFSAGSNQPLVVPMGRLYFKIAREDASKWGEQIVKLAEELPSTPDLTIATDLSQADEAARAIKGIQS